MKIVAITPDRKFDAVAAVIIEGLYSNGIEVIASDPGNGVVKTYSEQDVVLHSKDADFIFVLWGKVKGNRSPRYHLLDRINRPEITAYIDGSEWTCSGYPETNELVSASWMGGKKINRHIYESKLDSSRCKGQPWVNERMFKYCNWYFKRECYQEDKDRGIIPLNVGCSEKYFGNFGKIKKDIDIFCSFGHLMTGLRYETQNMCETLRAEGYNVKIVNNMPYKEYKKTMARSLIGISAWGAGNSCMRMWEIMANRSCCFTQRAEIEFPNRPVDGVHCVEYSNIEEFENKIRHYLKEREKCIIIGNNGYDHVKNFHIGHAKVKYMIDIMSKGFK